MRSQLKPKGHVALPLFIFSFVALILGFMVELLGVFDGINEALKSFWEEGGVELSQSGGLPGAIGVLLTAVAVFGLGGAVLATPGDGRRVVLGVSSLILTIAFLPVFAAWGVFWKPGGMTLAVFWAWGSTFLYARAHHMPCEVAAGEDPANLIPLSNEHELEDRSLRADG